MFYTPKRAMPASLGGQPTNMSGNANRAMHAAGQGGKPSTMLIGVAAVAAGLAGFWMLQYKKQGRRMDGDPADMPTWQYRHAQQVPEIMERHNSFAENTVRRNAEATRRQEVASKGAAHAQMTAPHQEATDTKKVISSPAEGGAVASVMTFLHGKPSDDKSQTITQPAPVRRLNDRGGMYTKNSDYKDGYRRD